MAKSKDSKPHSSKHESKKHKSSHTKESRKPSPTPDPNSNPNPNPNTGSVSATEIATLLVPYQKDQLVTFLVDAIVADPSLLSRVNQVADSETQHRKLFVHGFGYDATRDDMHNCFSQFGEIEECNMILNKNTGKSKGYGFVTFRTRKSASLALKEPHKKIGTRFTTCQLAGLGPVPSGSGPSNIPDTMARKIYVSNVHAETQPDKLKSLFENFGEIELGPIGFDLTTGKSRGFALFLYKTIEGAKKALEEPYKMFDGRLLHCELASVSNNKRKALSGSAITATAPPVAPGLVSNMALYGSNPFAALLGQNPFMAAASLNPLAGMFNPALSLNLNNLVGLNAATQMAPWAGNVGEGMIKSDKPSLLGAYQGPSRPGQSSSAGPVVLRFPGFKW